MSNAMDITSDNYEVEVEKSDKAVLVDFWAPWCGPCQMMGPVIDEVAAEMTDTLKVGKINCDDETELASRFGITGIPCLILFQGGTEKARRAGAIGKDDLVEWIKSSV